MAKKNLSEYSDGLLVEQTTKGRFGARVLVLATIVGFFASFAGFVLLLIGGVDNQPTMMIVGAPILAVGVICILLCFLPKKYDKTIIERLNLIVYKKIFGAKTLSIANGDISEYFLKEKGIEPVKAIEANWLQIDRENNSHLLLLEIKTSVVESTVSDNSAINKAMQIEAKHNSLRGQNDFRALVPAPFIGTIIAIEKEPFVYSRIEIRQLKDSISAPFLKELKQMESPNPHFEIWSEKEEEGNSIIKNKALWQILDEASRIVDRGLGLIIDNNNLYIEIYGLKGYCWKISEKDYYPGQTANRLAKKGEPLGRIVKLIEGALKNG